MLATGDAIWAVGRPDWDEPPAGRPGGKRPVVWEEPTDEEIARHQDMMRHLRFPGTDPLDDEEGRRTTVADWRDAEGDFEALMPPTPIWRVSAGTVRRIGVDLEQPILAAAGGKLAGVCRLPSDPIVKHLSPGAGSVSWRYPGTVVVIDDTGTLDVLGPVPGSGGAVCADDGGVWLLGFEEEADDSRPRRYTRSRSPKAGSGRFLACGHTGPWPSSAGSSSTWRSRTTDDAEADPGHGSAVIRFLPADGGQPWTAGPAVLGRNVLARARGRGDLAR